MKWTNTMGYSEMFGSQYLDVVTMNKAVERMYQDPELFRSFFENMRSYGPMSTDCKTDKCRFLTLCTINNTLYDPTMACFKKYGH